ncbi:MAG: hypothetical protein L3K02_04590, partial [Thermoplasmata archaeon]|nr:hypothetical protein [Thermoplasmata archaeon]
MKLPVDRRALLRTFGPAYGILAAASVGLALLTPLPPFVGVGLALGGATIASVLRALLPRGLRYLGLLPALAVLGIFVTDCPPGTIPELIAGVGGLAVLLWCSEDADRYAGSLGRGVAGHAVPRAVQGIAHPSYHLLPSGLGSHGLAA